MAMRHPCAGQQFLSRTRLCRQDMDDDDRIPRAMVPLADEASSLLRSMASPHRLMILALLMDRPRCVKEICQALDARQSLVSQHLTRLRLSGIVRAERHGVQLHYLIANSVVREIIHVMLTHSARRREG